MLYIVIPVLNRKEFTRNCLLSLSRQTYLDYKIIVVDHGSVDGTDAMIELDFKQVILLRTDNSNWWTGAMNIGIRKALTLSNNKKDFILAINNDLEVDENYLEELLKIYDRKRPAIVGSMTVNIENTNQITYCGTKWDPIFAKYTSHNLKTVQTKPSGQEDYIKTDLLPGRGTLYPIEVFKNYGLFDEKNFPHYAADEDYSRMVFKKGYKLIVSTKAVVKSYYKESGLKENKTNIIKYYSSLKSPANLKRRWLWASKNSPQPYIYFLFDFSRTFHSYIKYRLR